jgi:hypothetical protein
MRARRAVRGTVYTQPAPKRKRQTWGGRITIKRRDAQPVTFNAEYLNYIASPQWTRKKADYYSRHPRVCSAAGEHRGPVHLHHLTYVRLNHEWDADLTPLCEHHHEAAHGRSF